VGREHEEEDLETGVVNAAEFSRQSGGSNAPDRETQGEPNSVTCVHTGHWCQIQGHFCASAVPPTSLDVHSQPEDP